MRDEKGGVDIQSASVETGKEKFRSVAWNLFQPAFEKKEKRGKKHQKEGSKSIGEEKLAGFFSNE